MTDRPRRGRRWHAKMLVRCVRAYRDADSVKRRWLRDAIKAYTKGVIFGGGRR